MYYPHGNHITQMETKKCTNMKSIKIVLNKIQSSQTDSSSNETERRYGKTHVWKEKCHNLRF